MFLRRGELLATLLKNYFLKENEGKIAPLSS